MSKNSRAKIAASLLVILCVVGTLSFFAFFPYPTPKPQIQPESYVTSEIETQSYLVVWQPDTINTAVNQTDATFINFYRWTYNYTNLQISKTSIASWVINQTTKEIYVNDSATNAIQYAINQGNNIKIQTGTYDITKMLVMTKSGTRIDGTDSTLYVSGFTVRFQGQYVLMIPENVTDVSISNLRINGEFWSHFP